MFSKQGMFAYTEHCMTSLQNLGWEECDIFLEVFRSKAQDAALCLIAHLKKNKKKTELNKRITIVSEVSDYAIKCGCESRVWAELLSKTFEPQYEMRVSNTCFR